MKQLTVPLYKRTFIVFATCLFALSGMLLVTVKSASAAGTTYYVSPTGSDSNNGTSTSTPWKTITHVNSVHFNAGDTILFKGGSSFSGELYFAPGESGTAASPITVNSYGTGDATISGGSGSAIYAYDAAGFDIFNLTLTGAGAGSNTGSGINFYNDDSGNTTLNYVYVNDVTASGFQDGFSMGGGNGGSGYSNVTVTNSTFDNNQLAGLQTYGPTFNASSPTYVNQTVNIGYVTAYDNYGNSALTGSNDSGNGIVLGSTKNSNIYDSVAYSNGGDCTANSCGVGIWAYNSYLDTIEYNQSYDNQTGGPADGDGFDLDQNTSDSYMQYNYSHDNAGSGYLLFGASANESHTGNTVRFNISQNDGRKNSYGGIETYGNVAADSIYNNTVYASPSSGAKPTAIYIEGLGTGQTIIRNNIFYASGGVYPVVVPVSETTSALEFQQNDYYAFTAYWGTTTYTSLSSWQSATGEEKLNGAAVGYTVNPDLVDAGAGGTVSGGYNPTALTDYKLASGSPMKNAGINLTTQFGTNIGSTDYYGTSVPTSSGLSIGAAE
jgi:hypothetical protein